MGDVVHILEKTLDDEFAKALESLDRIEELLDSIQDNIDEILT